MFSSPNISSDFIAHFRPIGRGWPINDDFPVHYKTNPLVSLRIHCMDPLNFIILFIVNLSIISIFKMTKTQKEKMTERKSGEPMETGGAGGADINSAAIAKAHLLAERRFLDETGLPPLIGRSFSRHDIMSRGRRHSRRRSPWKQNLLWLACGTSDFVPPRKQRF